VILKGFNVQAHLIVFSALADLSPVTMAKVEIPGPAGVFRPPFEKAANRALK